MVENRFVDVAQGHDFRSRNLLDLLQQLPPPSADTPFNVDSTETDESQSNLGVRARTLRPAREVDVPVLLAMIRELAAFEQLSHEINLGYVVQARGLMQV